MAMGTESAAALTRASRKLKDLATDAITLPTAQQLYDRKVSELHDAQRKLDGIVKRQIDLEKQQPSQQGGRLETLLREKRDAEALVERLANESGMLKAEIVAKRPKPPLTPQQQIRRDALKWSDPYAGSPRGTAEQIAKARQDVDALVLEHRLTQPTGQAREGVMEKINAARTKLTVLEGLPYPEYCPWASNETLAKARKAEGLE